jgi:hypothetical protein
MHQLKNDADSTVKGNRNLALAGVEFLSALESLMGAIRNMNWTRLVPAFKVTD